MAGIVSNAEFALKLSWFFFEWFAFNSANALYPKVRLDRTVASKGVDNFGRSRQA
jgi:hypothetical protein